MMSSFASAPLALPVASLDALPLGGGRARGLARGRRGDGAGDPIGHRLTTSGGLRDFYLGGRRPPWYAVSASIIATEISAVTFFAVPSLVWREGGSIHYLQIGLVSALVARLVVASLTPAYYEKEARSPTTSWGPARAACVARRPGLHGRRGPAQASRCTSRR